MKISVAYIKAPRGFKGELTAIPYKEGTQSIRRGIRVILQKNNDIFDSMIEQVMPLNNRVAVKFKGIDDEETARNWRGAEILIEKEDLKPLEDGEYYHFELEGADVYFEDDSYLGKVESIGYLAANDVLNVKTENGEVIVPLIKSVIKLVDVENKKIVIIRTEGLF